MTAPAKRTPGHVSANGAAVVGTGGELSEADAALIAAAPTMLDALRLCRNYMDCCIPESADGADAEALRIVRIATAAIAAAEGRA